MSSRRRAETWDGTWAARTVTSVRDLLTICIQQDDSVKTAQGILEAMRRLKNDSTKDSKSDKKVTKASSAAGLVRLFRGVRGLSF